MLAPAVERLKWSEAQNGVEGPTEAHRWKWMHQEGFEFRNALFACLYNELFLVGLKPWPAGVAKLKTFEYNRGRRMPCSGCHFNGRHLLVIVRDVLRRASLHAALGNFCPDTSGFVPRTKDFANTTPFWLTDVELQLLGWLARRCNLWSLLATIRKHLLRQKGQRDNSW